MRYARPGPAVFAWGDGAAGVDADACDNARAVRRLRRTLTRLERQAPHRSRSARSSPVPRTRSPRARSSGQTRYAKKVRPDVLSGRRARTARGRSSAGRRGRACSSGRSGGSAGHCRSSPRGRRHALLGAEGTGRDAPDGARDRRDDNAFSTGMATSRVTTRTGRRSASAHQTSSLPWRHQGSSAVIARVCWSVHAPSSSRT